MESIESERPDKTLLSKRMVAWILLPTMIGVLSLVTIAVLSIERSIKHPEGVTVRDYWPTDGWKAAEPNDKGLDAAYLEEASRTIKEEFPTFVSFLVVRDGYLVWEDYFRGETNFRSNNALYSATKSVLATLIGIAIDEGLIDSVDQPISDFFPEYFAVHEDSEKTSITIHDLLTMRSGIEWDEENPVGLVKPDVSLIQQILELPSERPPGEGFNYSSADSHLLSAILTKATGESALQYADDRLFDPLGIHNRSWRQDSTGVTFGGTGLSLTARDLASIGLLYLDNGYWEGEQIVSKEWITEATYPHVALERSSDEPGAPPIGYGYHWWVRDQAGYDSYMALGYAGQYIIVVPELDLVVVITSIPTPWTGPTKLREATILDLDLIEKYVIPAVTNFPD